MKKLRRWVRTVAKQHKLIIAHGLGRYKMGVGKVDSGAEIKRITEDANAKRLKGQNKKKESGCF